MARLAFVDRWCDEHAGFGRTERDTLRARIRATENGEWAVAGALAGSPATRV